MSEYGPRSEAVRIFARVGLSESTLTRKTKPNRSNKIEIETQPLDGKERGVLYCLDQVREIATKHWDKKQSKKVSMPRSVIKFRRMEIGEMPIVADILDNLFVGYPNVEQWQERIKANEDIGYVVTDDGVIKGCGFIMPHTEEWILDIFPQEVTPITYPHDILQYEPGSRACLYLRSVGVLQKGVPLEKKKRWAQILIVGILKKIVELGDRGIFIDRIYARSDTLQGENMLRRLGFTQLMTTTSHENFVIDVKPSGITFIKQYKENLDRWRKAYEGG